MERVVVGSSGHGAQVDIAVGAPPAAEGDTGVGGALFRTVSRGADAVLDVIAGVEAPALVEALTAPEIGRLHGRRLVVRLARGVADRAVVAAFDDLLARFEDPRIFVAAEASPSQQIDGNVELLVADLAVRGFRTFLVDDGSAEWREVHPEPPLTGSVALGRLTTVYATPASRCRTVSTLVHRGGLSGAERSHAEMVESLVRQGGMAHTVVPLPDDGLRATLTSLGSSVDVIGALPWWMEPAGEIAGRDAGQTPRRLVDPAVLERLAAVGADVVMTQTSVVPQGAMAAAALGRPHVWFLREFGDIDQGLSHPWGRDEFARVVQSLSDVVVVNSGPVRDYLFDPGASAVRVLHPTPDVATATPVASPGPRPWTVSIVATVIPGKGQRDAVEAMAVLRHDAVPVRLALVGSDGGAEREALEDLARQRGVADRIEFRGEVRDRAVAYGNADAVAVTSRAEAFGRVPFEATAFGLPVIYANSGGPAEYMTAGVTGLAYTPGDAVGLADAIRLLRDDPVLAARLVAGARADFDGPERRQAFDDAVRDLFLPLTGRTPRPVPGHLLGAVVADTSSQVSEAGRQFAEQLESARRAHADLADERAARGRAEAENQALRAASAHLSDILNTRTWRLRNRLIALTRRRPR